MLLLTRSHANEELLAILVFHFDEAQLHNLTLLVEVELSDWLRALKERVKNALEKDSPLLNAHLLVTAAQRASLGQDRVRDIWLRGFFSTSHEPLLIVDVLDDLLLSWPRCCRRVGLRQHLRAARRLRPALIILNRTTR